MSKVIDAREGGGEVVILGKALVLPASSADGADMPLNGSVRYNPDNSAVEVYTNGSWAPLGSGDGGSASHTHPISQVIGLLPALASKASINHAHDSGEITGLTAALGSKADLNHTHDMDNVGGLVNSITTLTNDVATLTSTKAPTQHNHTVTAITGLQGLLDNKAPALHTHALTDIQDLSITLQKIAREQIRVFVPGNPPTGYKHIILVGARTHFPQNFASSRAKPITAPSSNYIIDVRQNDTLVGAITIQGTNGFASFSTTNPQGSIWMPGDVITLEFPTNDAAIAGIAITLVGELK